MNEKVLAVDIGTSSIKAGILDKNGKLLFSNKFIYEQIGGDVYNWDTDCWVNSLKTLLSEIPEIKKISAAVFSGSGPTIIPIDKNGNYKKESLLWIDNKKIDLPGIKSFFLPKIKWFKENRADVYDSVSCFLPLSGFFPYLLTGEIKEPVPNNKFAPYMWTKDDAQKSGIDFSKLPNFAVTGELIGSVNKKGESDFFIKEGTPIFAGANDYLVALLGTGTVFEGAVCDRAGTSEGINYCSRSGASIENLRVLPHIIEDFYSISGVLASSGKIFDWFKKLSGRESKPYEDLIKEALPVIMNNDHLYFFPSLKRDSVWQFSGGAFVGLQIKHGAAETGAAVLKSIGFSVREVIRIMEENSLNIQEIRLSGGQAKNPLWNQLKANMIGKTLLVPEVIDGELLGCACAAFKGLGVYSTLSQASSEMVKIKDIYKPDFTAYKYYSKMFEEYSRISLKLESFADSI